MDSYKAFKEKLDLEHKWPAPYLFKFVVPSTKVDEFKQVFPEEPFQSKESKAGNYVSFSMKKVVKSSDEVVDLYIKAKEIEGLIAL